MNFLKYKKPADKTEEERKADISRRTLDIIRGLRQQPMEMPSPEADIEELDKDEEEIKRQLGLF